MGEIDPGKAQANRRTGNQRGLTRRRFLAQSSAGLAGLVAGPQVFLPRWARGFARNSKIVRASHPDATTGWTTVNQEPVSMMVHAAIRELTGIGHTGMAWKSLFPGVTAASRFGIKINLACGDVPTHPEVVNAIIDGLLMMDLGGQQLPENQIIVHDLDTAFFCEQTGYQFNYGGEGVQYYGTDHPDVGFDLAVECGIDHPHNSHTVHHPSVILTQRIDYLINAAVIKDHSEAGVTLCLKNHYGSFDNVAINQMHSHWYYGDGHTRGEPSLNAFLRDQVSDKTKLFLIDGTFGLYDGGPGYVPPYHTPPNWAYNSVLVGFDPVACDRIGTVKINEERANHGLGAIDPSHVSAAAGEPYNLGTDQIEQIDLVEIDASVPSGVTDGIRSGDLALLAPYPNPSRGECQLRFRTNLPVDAELVVVDATGRVVRRLGEGSYPPGIHRAFWNTRDRQGRRVPAGVYFCTLRAGNREQRERIVVIR